MRHARFEELEPVMGLIFQVRAIKGLNERTQGHFYYKGKNVLHFHIDGSNIFCDIGDLRLKVEEGNYQRILSEVRKKMDSL